MKYRKFVATVVCRAEDADEFARFLGKTLQYSEQPIAYYTEAPLTDEELDDLTEMEEGQ